MGEHRSIPALSSGGGKIVAASEAVRLIRDGDLSSVRVGRRRLIPESSLDEFIAARLRESVA